MLSIKAASSFSDKACISPHADVSLIRNGLFFLSVRYLWFALNLSGNNPERCADVVKPVMHNSTKIKIAFNCLGVVLNCDKINNS